MHPDWLGSPQHVVGGFVLALFVVLVAQRWIEQWWLLAALAVGVTATAELVIELVEYPLLYAGDRGVADYWDTLADLASTLAGGLIGTAAGLVLRRPRARGRAGARRR